MKTEYCFLPTRSEIEQSFANIANETKPEAQIFVNIIAIDNEGWAQLAPFGDHYNVDSKGNRVIQRFEKTDADTIVNEFNSLLHTPQRLLGLPWYIGHPDHPRFANTHRDNKAYGRIKKLEVRDDGLYANVKFGTDGRRLVEDESFHGHSVNWRAVPSGQERGMTIFRPVSLKSVGFTNDPQIPARPVTMANDAADLEEDDLSNETMIIPPKLKVLAGFPEDADVTMEQILAALEKARPNTQNLNLMNERKIKVGGTEYTVQFANDADGEKAAGAIEKVTSDLQALETKANADKEAAATELANEKARAQAVVKSAAVLVVDKAIAEGRVLAANKEATVTELCNAADFDVKADEIGKLPKVVKTGAKSTDLGKNSGEILANVRERSAKFEALIAARKQQFPSEDYSVTFANVANTPEGKALLEQMNQAKEEANAA